MPLVIPHLPWLRQPRGTTDCQIYAIANGARFYGMDTPVPGTGEWQAIVDMVGASSGSAMAPWQAAWAWGMDMILVPEAECALRAPTFLSLEHPEYGPHTVLCIGQRGDTLGLVNYHLDAGPAEDWIPYYNLAPDARFAQTFHLLPRTRQITGTQAVAITLLGRHFDTARTAERRKLFGNRRRRRS